jgi:energy-coupling factor transporter ATP-binding protein EcfA2
VSTSDEFQTQVFERLVATQADDDVVDAVLAACGGDGGLEGWLSGERARRPAPGDSTPATATPGAYLTSWSASGFRGIGPPAKIDFTPGPGLHVVVGRNGSGKSSFAEAFEVLLTGHNRRLDERTAAWKAGWKNLHEHASCRVGATFQIDGDANELTLWRDWPESVDALDGASTEAQRKGDPKTNLDGIGWSSSIAAYRPMLSAVDFEDVVGKPSQLYELLAGVLGLDEYTAARKRLNDANAQLKKTVAAGNEQLAALRNDLTTSTNEQATRCLAILATDAPDLDELERAATTTDERGEIEFALQQLANLQLPSLDAVQIVATQLRAAAEVVDSVRTALLAQTSATLRLLDAAMAFHHDHGDQACPVCGVGQLNAEWRAAADESRESLRRQTSELSEAEDVLRRALSDARELVVGQPAALGRADLGFATTAASTAWMHWGELSAGTSAADARRFADHLERHSVDLHDACTPVIEAAAARVAELDASWRPIAAAVSNYLANARAAARAAPRQKAAAKGVKWLDAEIDRLRTERFAPLADEAQQIWSTLRTQSNVSLEQIGLAGTSTQRRVDVSLAVDGAAAELGVLSQGEVNALALSMFVPRAARAASPFRFLVIDDPVQSMDPAKVEGLARLLSSLAETRQVIVLTHDERLPNALRRLAIPSRVVELTRRQNSVVETSESQSPTRNALASARAIAKDADVPADIRARVVPGFCRLALEATLDDVAWRRLLKAGTPHSEVERLLDDATTLHQRAAVGLFGDLGRGSDVYSTLNSRFGAWAVDTFKACKAGAHGEAVGDVGLLVKQTDRLAQAFEGVA